VENLLYRGRKKSIYFDRIPPIKEFPKPLTTELSKRPVSS